MNDIHADSRRDAWTSGESYESYVGRWSEQVAERFIAWLRMPLGRAWIDVGCGTGAVTRTILANGNPNQVVSVDQSEAFLQFAQAATGDERVSFRQGNARQLPVDADAFDAAISGLVLNFIPEPVWMVREMERVVRPGGVVALYVWDYAGEMQMMRHFWSAAVETDPAAADLDEGKRFPIANLTALRSLFEETGLQQIVTDVIDISTTFADFDAFWHPFLLGQGPAPTYVQSLTDAARQELREAVRRRLPIQPDGTISMIARALAIKAVVE